MLTSERSIEALEAAVKKAANASTFKLAGSISSDLTDEELEAAIKEGRRKWAEESARRAEDFLRD